MSIFEHAKTDFQYSYTQFLEYDKGLRGLTVGRIFVTGTTEEEFSGEHRYHAYDVIKRYEELGGLNRSIINLANTPEYGDDFREKLQYIKDEWETFGDDPKFKQAQDEIFNDIAYKPALNKMNELGATLPLTLLALLDAYVLQGEGGDDGVTQMIKDMDQYDYKWDRSKTKFANLDEEKEWLESFLYTRDYIISQPKYQYGDSKYRIFTLLDLFYQKEYYLNIGSVNILYSSDNPNHDNVEFEIDSDHLRKQFY